MGIGKIGQMGEDICLKHKIRWTFSANFNFGQLSENIIQLTTRPSLNVPEIQNEDGTFNADMKNAKWEPIEITYLNYETECLTEVYELASKIFYNKEISEVENPPDKFYGTGILNLYSNGQILETWKLEKLIPTQIHFNNFHDGDQDVISITWKYNSVCYQSMKNNIKEAD